MYSFFNTGIMTLLFNKSPMNCSILGRAKIPKIIPEHDGTRLILFYLIDSDR